MSEKQICSLRESTARINIWEGSVRSGKTIASLARFLIYVATNTTRGELVVVSRTRDSAARNVFAPLMDPNLFGATSRFVSYTSGAAYGMILGRKVWVLGSSDIRSENVLRGLTCAGAYVDELTLLREDFFTQLLNRLWEGAQLFGTTNPDSPGHWFKVNFLDRCDPEHPQFLPDWKVWKFLLDDNPMLSEARKDAIRRENTGLYYRRNVLGEWVAAEGAIFETFDPDLKLGYVIEWDDLPPMAELIAVGMDYGTSNPTAALLLGISAELDQYNRPAPRLYLIDEYYFNSKVEQRQLPPSEQARELKAWIEADHLPPNSPRLTPRFIILDPSAAPLRTELAQQGVMTTQADNEVLYGVRTMASLIYEKKLITTTRCKNFIREAPGYSWDPKATLLGADKPMKVNDHACDAVRYAVITTENIWRSRIKFELAA
ncbi:PBSX family phage terminase large subunit [Glaciihabitans sp. dw_435]|uniref:PBSX family phage terminase large subunit n=1 Tax=Glaciihabitans sp. dw_435 TaxID=2720081 RepID=UPI001BD37E80|nr:PBSX family phage terminase large subunit [Glaciihabitans sp. dw_435]